MTTKTTPRTYSFHSIGRWNGKGPVLFMIRFYKADGSFGSCQTVEETALADELTALHRIGYLPKAYGA